MQVPSVSDIRYHKPATLALGNNIGKSLPSFESVAITCNPNPSIVFMFSDFGQALQFILNQGVESLRKEFRYGQWSPGQGMGNVTFGFFTNGDKEYVTRMAKLIAGDQWNEQQVQEFIGDLEQASSDRTSTQVIKFKDLQ
jgi:hypothetical protein